MSTITGTVMKEAIPSFLRYRTYGDGGFRRYAIVWLAVAIHWWQGILLIKSDSTAWVTSIAHVIRWMHLTPDQLGVIYLIIGTLAVLGWLLFPRGHIVRLILATPQQGFLMVAALGAIYAMSNSQFADGVIRPTEFISADQCTIVISAVLHSFVILNGRLDALFQKVNDSI